MLKKYKIQVTKDDLYLPINLSNENTKYNDDTVFIESEIQKSINPIVNLEKEAYEPMTSYTMQFKFFTNNSYTTNFGGVGFTEPKFQTKNSFKKSLFLFEFYDALNSPNNMLFTTTVGVNPSPANGKGVDLIGNTPQPSLTVNQIKNDLYLIFFNRDFSSLKNIKTEGGKKYVSLYVKSMFLNAKTGKVHYFMNIPTDTIISNSEFNEALFYHEIRFFEDFTYSFYEDNTKLNNIIYREVAFK